MADEKEAVVEKRVSRTVIRRRRKKIESVLPDEEMASVASETKPAAQIEGMDELVKAANKEADVGVHGKAVLKAEEVALVEAGDATALEGKELQGAGEEASDDALAKKEAGEKPLQELSDPVFPGRSQATPEQIQRAVELSRAKSAARKAEKDAPREAESSPARKVKSSVPSVRKTELPVDVAASQAAVAKADASRAGKKRPRKETSFIAKKDKEKELRFTRKIKKKSRSEEEQKQTEITVPKAIKRIIKINEVVLISDLARSMSAKSGDVIKKLMDLGVMATLNKSIDFETSQIVASEFGYEVVNEAFQEDNHIGTGEDRPEDLVSRAPIVTVMGHVDHGKTTLLDAIRKTKVVDTEAGGITQHIGAYRVSREIKGKLHDIVFIDTPGHEAFTAMRARGARVTDLVVLVVAAEDGVMPQTIEAINHSKAAGAQVLVAINKVDKPGADVAKIKRSLTEFDLVAEEWGGSTIIQEVSALKGTGIEALLEMIVLQTEILELKANVSRNLEGIVIEGKLEKGRGPVATIIVKNGTVRVGDYIVCGIYSGRVRALMDDEGKTIDSAGPSTPVEVLGLSGVPKAGDTIHTVDSEKISKEVSEQRSRKARDTELMKSSKVSLEDLYRRIEEGDVQTLNVILKTDVQGTGDAVLGGLEKLSTDKVKIKAIHGSVGAITETDVNLASASDALIIGFNIRPSRKVTEFAVAEGVSIKTYTVIYELLDEVRQAMEGLLAPREIEKYHSRVKIRNTFQVSRVGTIAGCYVSDGKVCRGDRVRVLRDDVVIYEGKLASLKRFKDDAKEVASGYECGISVENYNDIKIDDELETYSIEKVASKL